MSKSFDDKIRDSLANYQATPPSGAKEAILGSATSGFTWEQGYHIAGGILLLFAMFMTGYQRPADLGSEANKQEQSIDNSILKSNLNHLTEATEYLEATTPISIAENLKTKQASQATNDKQIIGQLTFPLEKPALIDPDDESINSFTTYDMNMLEGEINYAEGIRELMPPMYWRRWEITPEKKAFFQPYFDVGGFFLYNRIKPNLSDDIYVGDYDAPFSISASRIGLALSGGLQKEWNNKLTTRLGLMFNNYNQHFSFSVRNTTPDSVKVVNEYVEPIFNKENVQISKRISTLGIRLQQIWSIPSIYNSIYLSAEYQHRISAGATFRYQGREHSLATPSQWMVEFGLRKHLAQLRSGHLYIIPGIRYSISKIKDQGILNVKPFSVGVSMSYTLK